MSGLQHELCKGNSNKCNYCYYHYHQSLKKLFIHVFDCAGFSLLHLGLLYCGKWGLLFIEVCKLLIVAAAFCYGAQVQQLWHASLAAPQHVDLPRPGIEPVSPASAGRFLITDHQGSPSIHLLRFSLNISHLGDSLRIIPLRIGQCLIFGLKALSLPCCHPCHRCPGQCQHFTSLLASPSFKVIHCISCWTQSSNIADMVSKQQLLSPLLFVEWLNLTFKISKLLVFKIGY